MNEIVKVQLPLSTNEAVPQMLVYNEDRSINIQTPIQDRFYQDLKRYPHKGYYEAVVTGDIVDIGKRAEDQPW
jgi:hypothetical protein